MNNEIVNCNECGKNFTVDVKTMKHPNDIVETYFKCTHCYYHYTSYVENNRVRKLKRKLNKLSTNNQGIYLDKDKSIEIREDIKKVMEQLKYNLVNYGRADI